MRAGWGEGGDHPDPSGRFLVVANQNSDVLAAFRIDPDTGKLADTGQRAEIGTPMCVKFARH